MLFCKSHRTGWGLGGWGLQASAQRAGRSFLHPAAAAMWLWAAGCGAAAKSQMAGLNSSGRVKRVVYRKWDIRTEFIRTDDRI